MYETIFTKKLADGRLAEVKVQEYMPGQYRCLLYLMGRWVEGPAAPQRLRLPQGELTHYPGGDGGQLMIGLTSAEVVEIARLLDGKCPAW
jgi:hypothetical protein